MLTLGRLTLGFAIVGFGLVGLVYADFLNSLQPVPTTVPGHAGLAMLNAIAFLTAGAAILADRGSRHAATVVAVLFLGSIVVLHVPSAFTQPELLRSPWWIRTFESVALIGGAVTLVGLRNVPAHDRWIRGGRLLFGLSLPVFGILHLIYVPGTATLVPPWYPWPMFWAAFTGVAQIAGGLAIALGVWPRLAAILAGVMYGAWGLTLHLPRVWCQFQGSCTFLGGTGGAGPRGEITSMFVAFAMCGAAWIVASGVAADRRA